MADRGQLQHMLCPGPPKDCFFQGWSVFKPNGLVCLTHFLCTLLSSQIITISSPVQTFTMLGALPPAAGRHQADDGDALKRNELVGSYTAMSGSPVH